MKIIAQGAEAVLIKNGKSLIKDRIKKNYRLEEIDVRIRKFRTKREVKLLTRLDFAPNVFSYNDFKIEMEFIDGFLLKDILDSLNFNNRKKILIKVGNQIAKMHDLNVIHGDLTTSNMILKGDKIYFIDFGLGFISFKIEDRAVDLKLFKQALEAKHYKHFDENYKFVLQGYSKYKDFKKVMARLEKVEKRGRYKRKV